MHNITEYDYDCVESDKYYCENCFFKIYNDERFLPKTRCIEERRNWMLKNRSRNKSRSLFDDIPKKFKFETDGTYLKKYGKLSQTDYVEIDENGIGRYFKKDEVKSD